MAGLPVDVWITLIFSILAFWGVATWALLQTLWQEEGKLSILTDEDAIDSYSPEALRDLRAWVETHPNDPAASEARALHNQCVDNLKRTNRHFYNWDQAEIEHLEKV